MNRRDYREYLQSKGIDRARLTLPQVTEIYSSATGSNVHTVYGASFFINNDINEVLFLYNRNSNVLVEGSSPNISTKEKNLVSEYLRYEINKKRTQL